MFVDWVDDWLVIFLVIVECVLKGKSSYKLFYFKGFINVLNFLYIRKKDESKYDVQLDGIIFLVFGFCNLIVGYGDIIFIGKCQ